MKRASAVVSFLVTASFLMAAAAPAKRQITVAYVLDSQPLPRDFRAIALQGFQRAVDEFGVYGRVVVLSAVIPTASAAPTLSSLARQKYDLVITGAARSFGDIEAVYAVAARFPATTFVVSDAPLQALPSKPRNVQGSLWRVEQPAFLAGYLAALMERRRAGDDVIGAVGGFSVPQVNTFIAGYEAGARKASPDIRLLRDYAQSLFDASKCEAVARRQIGKRAGALFNVGGLCGLGTLRATQAAGVWGIGVDVDQSYLGTHVLTSVLKRWDVQAYRTIGAYVHGTLQTGRDRVWNLRNGGVGLGKINSGVPRSFVRRVENVEQQIVAGTIKVPTSLN